MDIQDYTSDTLRNAVLNPPAAPSKKLLRTLEELDRELSEPSEVDPSYLEYEVRSIF